MAVKKATTKEDVTEAPAPDGAEVKTVTLESPWGSKVTVSEDLAGDFTDAGFTK